MIFYCNAQNTASKEKFDALLINILTEQYHTSHTERKSNIYN